MKKEGEVLYSSVHGDYGYVEFAHYDDMKHALKYLDDTELVSHGERSRIRVYRARDSSRSSSRHRSRGYSHRDSRSHRDRSRSRRDSHSRVCWTVC